MAFNHSDFTTFVNRFSRFTREYESFLHRFILREAQRFIDDVKPRTPVDTGDLRDHWAIESVRREGNNLVATIVNPMEYASYVEYGHATPYHSGAGPGSGFWVDGVFMMTISLDKIRREMPSRFRNEFRRFCQQMEIV